MGVDVYFYIFLTSALVADQPASRLCPFILGETAPSTNWIWGRVEPRAGLDDMKKLKFLILPGLELPP
jgi:hypothetical protein